MRSYLVVIDDTPESGVALRFAARRAVKTGGGVEIACVVPEPEFMAFGGVPGDDRGRSAAACLKGWSPRPRAS
jgi:nucleotide-binding universal stress UspA family protein